MANGQKGEVVRQLGHLLECGSASALSEWQLLQRYVRERDEAAFEALVARHGPMVFGVCRRILRNTSDVEDAFQATFLVLVRRASSLGANDLIGPWLYGVAHRVALRAQVLATKRQVQQPNLEVTGESREAPSSSHELGWVLEEELSRLPKNYRLAIVLCYLQGLTHEEAAHSLRWPLGTVKGRLARARTLLKSRLVRRGITPTAGAALATLSREASAKVPESLAHSTVQIAARITSGMATSEAIPITLAALLPGGFTMMHLMRHKLAASVASAIVIALVGVSATQLAKGKQPGQRDLFALEDSNPLPQAKQPVETSPTPNTETAKRGLAAAVAPQVTSKDQIAELRAQEREIAKLIFEDALKRLLGGESKDFTAVAHWSKKIVDSVGDRPSDKIAALEQHRERMQKIETELRKQAAANIVPQNEVLLAQFFTTEAERLLLLARDGLTPTSESSGKPFLPSDQEDPRSQRILGILETSIEMSFANETPFEEVLKYLKETAHLEGLPVYVDPAGLQDAEKTMTSPVTLDLPAIPLKTALKLVLDQLGMVYEVHDGVLTITSPGRKRTTITPLVARMKEAERGELSMKELHDLIEQCKLISQIKQFKVGAEAADSKAQIQTQ